MTAFAEALGNGFISAFETLGVEPAMARRGASKYASIDSWVMSQVTQTAVGGGLASAIPGVHHAGAVVDLGLVMHKIAIMAWGVGYKNGCQVDGRLDLVNILALWSGAATGDMLEVAGTTALVGGTVAAGSVAYGSTSAFAVAFSAKVAGKAANMSAAAVLTKMGAKGAGKLVGAVAGQLASLTMKAIAPQIGTMIAGKFTAKQFVGWIPVVGALAAGGINIWVMNGVADAARRYYSAKASS